MFIVDDKICSTKNIVSCQLYYYIIIIIRGSWLRGGCIYHLDCLIGVIPMLVFLVCCLFVFLDNKLSLCFCTICFVFSLF